MKGLYEAVFNFVTAGIKRIWVNGSFITNKPDPKDIDGCWEYSPGVDLKKLDPVFRFTSRMPMKAKFGLDFFPSSVVELSSGLPFPEFFQTNPAVLDKYLRKQINLFFNKLICFKVLTGMASQKESLLLKLEV